MMSVSGICYDQKPELHDIVTRDVSLNPLLDNLLPFPPIYWSVILLLAPAM